MKLGYLNLLLVMLSTSMWAQEMEGVWYGSLEVGGNILPLEVHCDSDSEGPYTLYSKKQTIQPIAINEWKLKKGFWTWESSKIGARYQGEWDAKEERFKGVFTQGGMDFELQFSKQQKAEEEKAQHAQMVKRPQTPMPPFHYPTEELSIPIKMSDGSVIQIAGTLSLPSGTGPFPCLILITGSGPQDRDETILGHKPFAIIADTLAKLGWATFRYDERGVAASTGYFSTATSADFASDVAVIFSYLQKHSKLNPKKIGLLGHSEGSMVASIVAAVNHEVWAVLSLAGPGVRGLDLLQRQSMDIQMSNGKKRDEAQRDVDFNTRIMNFIVQTDDSVQVARFIHDNVVSPDQIPESTKDSKLEGQEIFDYYNNALNTRWMRYFIRYTPADYWSKVQCPVLVLNGDVDLQVNAEQNATQIFTTIPHHQNNELVILSNHNHLFQYSETGKISEYGIITESLSLETIEVIADWLKKLP